MTSMDSSDRTRARKGGRTARYGIASLVLVGALLSPTVVSAQETASETETEAGYDDVVPHRVKHRLDRMCHRVPRIERRTEQMLERINGDETTRGSLVWLDARSAQARESGHPDLASVIDSHRAIRAAAVPLLEVRQTEMAKIRDICIDHGIPL